MDQKFICSCPQLKIVFMLTVPYNAASLDAALKKRRLTIIHLTGGGTDTEGFDLIENGNIVSGPRRDTIISELGFTDPHQFFLVVEDFNLTEEVVRD